MVLTLYFLGKFEYRRETKNCCEQILEFSTRKNITILSAGHYYHVEN